VEPTKRKKAGRPLGGRVAGEEGEVKAKKKKSEKERVSSPAERGPAGGGKKNGKRL